MTKREHLLTILMEECSELAQRASKALRFGLEEIQPGQPLTNAERMGLEMADLIGLWRMLCEEGVVAELADLDGLAASKAAKVEQFLELSRRQGTLEE